MRPDRGLWSRRYAMTRLPLATAAITFGYVCARHSEAIRSAEAQTAGELLSGVFGQRTVTISNDSTFFLLSGDSRWTGYAVTLSCSTALLLPALALLTAALLLIAPIAAHAPLVSFAAASVLFAVINQLRLVGIGLADKQWGLTGFEVAHTWLGTGLTIAGMAVAGGVHLYLISQLGKSRRNRPPESLAPADPVTVAA